MGGAVSTGEDNDELVDNLLKADYIKSAQVEKVFRSVDRADYYTDECKQNAYKDLAWKNGNLHLSAPCVYSEVMENLKLEPGISFLNLGSGTGYLSTMAGLIIGSGGINHGVEIHCDVVEYANERLQSFLKNSRAIDDYDFCVPTFTVGNCLWLEANTRKYDRVYCGAACPEEYEFYIKDLLKVCGILVMPFNDQLLQITRVSQNEWEKKFVLPVSFATLVVPKADTAVVSVKLSEVHPLGLQELCRITIRRHLRNVIAMERCPLGDEDATPSQMQPEPSSSSPDEPKLAIRLRRGRDRTRVTSCPRNLLLMADHSQHQLSTFVQLARVFAGSRTVRHLLQPNSASSSEENNASPPMGNSAHTRRKLDSGLGDDAEADMDASDSVAEKDSKEKALTMDSSSDSDYSEDGGVMDTDTGAEVDTDTDSSPLQEGERERKRSASPDTPRNTRRNFTARRQFAYSKYLKEKIYRLPLPCSLKTYVNCDREL